MIRSVSNRAGARVFISSVTPELGRCREAVAQEVRIKELETRVQEDFAQGGGTLLEWLRDKIAECDAVILLMGQRAGAFPTEDHAAVLGPIDQFNRYVQATGQTGASYTQWEYLLAKHLDKLTYVFFSGPDYVPDQPDDEAAEGRASQAAFLNWVKRTGKHRGTFADVHELRLKVARLNLVGESLPKPSS